MAIDPNTGQPIPDVPTETPQTNQETQQPVEQPLFTSQSIEGGTYQGNIPAAVEKLKAAGISNPTEQQITDYFQLGGYYQVARDIEKAFKYPDQILSADGKPGKLEGESYSERSALQPVGDFNTANSYWDASRGVQVFAPAGQHFELYSNGAVKKVAGPVPVAGLTPGSKGGDNAPASSLFTQPTQADPNNPGGIRATPGFQQQQLGYQPIQGKTIETTGRSVFNPTTGVNEYAGPDEVLIKYTDGTVERRKVGAQPGQATPVGEFGRTPQELGITQDTGIKNEAGVQQPITRVPGSAASIQSQGLTGYANLEYIGPSYTTPDGKVRTAKEGNAFYQDPKSRTIVERQDRGQEASLQSTSQSVLAARQKLEGQIKSYLPNTDTTQLEQSFQDNPIKSFQDLYSSILEQQGVTTIKSEIESIQKEQEKLDNSFADEVQKINDNPYFSEAQRVDKIRVAQEKYDTKRSQLAARLTLQDSLLQESRQEAQYISSQALSQYNADRTFQQQEIFHAQDLAERKLEAQAQLELSKAQFQTTSALALAKFNEDTRQFGLTYALDKYKAENPSSGSGSLFERLITTLPLTDEQKMQAVYSQLGITPPGGSNKPLSGDASKVYAITQSIQPEIDQLISAYTKDYKGSVAGIITGTNRDLSRLASNVADKVGRLRSGGAINDQEAANFMKQIASATDLIFGNKDGAIQALNNLKNEAITVEKSITSGASSQNAPQNSDPLGILGPISSVLGNNAYASSSSTGNKAEEQIIKIESGGKTTAKNPNSTAFGLGQLIVANRIKYANRFGFDPNTTDYNEQLQMMRAYIKDRYGTPEAALQFHLANGWY